jgi:GTP-binding protein
VQVQSVAFHRAAYRPEDFVRDDRPQFAFVGRSNVGKSTLVNTLLRRKNLARVSQTPGKTQAVHYILLNERAYLVDLPGYGYAKVSKSTRATWGSLMKSYFESAETLRLFFVLLDCRRMPSDDDRIMFDLASSVGVPTQVVLTKADKLSRGALAQAQRKIAKELELDPHLVIPFSGETRLGVEKVWREIDQALSSAKSNEENHSSTERSTI